MTYWLCDAGMTLRGQVDKRWPKRDRASDGWIGDASHEAVPSDHNPCWSCTGERNGVVRALDIDSTLDRKDPGAAQRLANQLIKYARDREPGSLRLSYVIFNGKIASGTYADRYWVWRAYEGDDPHTNHIHVSFTSYGDFNGRVFQLPIFIRPIVQKLRDALAEIKRHMNKLSKQQSEKQKRLDDLTK